MILLTTDGGGHWAEAGGLPGDLGQLNGVACARPGPLLGGRFLHTRSGGGGAATADWRA